MKSFGQFKTKFLMLFLISGILVLSISFIFISCGSGPQTKVQLTNKEAYAVDINGIGKVTVTNIELPDFTEKGFTIEAWVKSKVDSPGLNGGIFSRYDSKGVVMWVKANKPKFAIRYLTLVDSVATSADYIIDSGVTMDTDTWYHIAGVLVNEDHSAVPGHPFCPDGSGELTGGEAEKPHLDIYVNGTIQNCATTYEYGKLDSNGDPITTPQFAVDPDDLDGMPLLQIGRLQGGGSSEIRCIDPVSDRVDMAPTTYCVESTSLHSATRFDGIIDDVRFWSVARKPSEILACKDQMLGLTGVCKIDPFILKGYWLFNEGQGVSITDASGSGFSGSLFDGVWVAGIL